MNCYSPSHCGKRISFVHAQRKLLDYSGRTRYGLTKDISEISHANRHSDVMAWGSHRSSTSLLIRAHDPRKETTPQPSPLNIQNVTSALSTAQRTFEKYDLGKKGSLTLKEATELLNRQVTAEFSREIFSLHI